MNSCVTGNTPLENSNEPTVFLCILNFFNEDPKTKHYIKK